jgi:uncharacterized protein (TIGR03437 family)
MWRIKSWRGAVSIFGTDPGPGVSASLRCAALLFAFTPLLAQSVPNTARSQDLSYVATQLPKLDPFFFVQLSVADFNRAVSALQSQIPTLTDAQFYVGLAQLVAMAGDAHTYVDLVVSAGSTLGFQSFPLFFRWLDDGIFVTGASADYSQAIGTRVIAVGGTPIDQVVQMLGTTIPYENTQWLHYRVQQYLRVQQILEGLGIVPVSPASPFTFADMAGNQFTLQVATGNQPLNYAPDPSLGPEPLFLQHVFLNYWYTYVAPLRLLYFGYASCNNDTSNPFPAFAASLLQTLSSNPVDTLVFDFRGNAGGDSSVINPLINGLEQLTPRLLANPAFRAYLLIDKGTFSSGLDDAMYIKSLALSSGGGTWLVVTGEPSGGKPTHYGNVEEFALPGSQLGGQYSTAIISAPPGIPADLSFNPDLPVGMRSTDYFARFDPVTAESLARWNGTTSEPTGTAIVVNGASFRVEEGLAPGSFASVFGAFGQVPDQVVIGGVPGNILSASSTQVNFLVPTSLKPGPTTVSVRARGAEVASGTTNITPAGPGLFVLQSTDPSQPGAVENQDYSVNSETNSAAAGSILQIFATGYGPLDATGSAPVGVVIGGTPAQVLFSGPVQQFPGLWQINAQIPAGLTGQLGLYLVAGNAASNAVTVWAH